MTTIWVDASSGASGDMLLGALLDAGVPLGVVQEAVDAVVPGAVRLEPERLFRNGFVALRCAVDVGTSRHRRTWVTVREMLASAPLAVEVRDLAVQAFEALAVAEGAVHGVDPEDVHFHEVGALDAIADVVGVSAGFAHLAPSEVVVSRIAVGSGSVSAAHGFLPVPPPAVVRLLLGVPSYAGPPTAPAAELCTPTGAALLTTVATSFGPQPAMTARAVGVGAGARDPEGHANVVRVLVGDSDGGAGGSVLPEPIVLETNIDDLDPRVWPAVIESVLAAGASDAWVTPILMKKGRPAHTLSVLVPPAMVSVVRDTVFRQTSTLGLREHRVVKHELDRDVVMVDVEGHRLAIKRGWLDGEVVNLQPEYDDVARVAGALGRPVADVLREATSLGESVRRDS